MPEGMATSTWRPRGAWAEVARVGRHGLSQGDAGVRLALVEGMGLATLIAADGREDALRRIMIDRFSWHLPEPGRANVADGQGLVWSAPGQWLAVAEIRQDLNGLAEAVRGIAAVTDQSDARALVRVSGPSARTALSKGLAIDLHPSAFQAGHAAVTSIAHIGAQIWQRDEAPTYDLTVARSFAGSFWSWLDQAAAEFGYEVVGTFGT